MTKAKKTAQEFITYTVGLLEEVNESTVREAWGSFLDELVTETEINERQAKAWKKNLPFNMDRLIEIRG